jgi:hypothetical protein
MLKWTCRLRDALERRGFWDELENPLSNLREAEFDDANGTFPDSFRWDTLRGCLRVCLRGCLCDGGDTCVTLFDNRYHQRNGLAPAFDRRDPKTQSIRRLCGTPVADLDRHDIDVLWLSPSVFISAVDFELPGADGDPMPDHDYVVHLTEKQHGREFRFYAFSLSWIEGNGFAAPSPLPLQLLGHVAANLPDGYFKMLELYMSCERIDERLPVECLLHFVSIVPGDPTSPPVQNDTIELKIGTKMNFSDLQELFSHHFHPLVELSFLQSDISVPLSAFLHLSRHAPHLRTVNLPFQFFEGEDSGLEHPKIVGNATFKSGGVTMQCRPEDQGGIWEPFSHVMLHKIATGFGSNGIEMTVWHGERDFVHLCIEPFLHEDSVLERLDIELYVALESSSNTITKCDSRSLCFFDALFHNDEGELISAHLESWDRGLFPCLCLNYCRKHVTQRVCGGAMPLAINAVNAGNVYSKTTRQQPFDMSTANAGLIFRFLKSEVDTLHDFDECARPPSLPGKKRPAPW